MKGKKPAKAKGDAPSPPGLGQPAVNVGPHLPLARGGKAKKALGKQAKKRSDKKSRSGIHIKESHKGLLHKDTKTPAGEPISEEKLEKEKNSPDPAKRKRAVFAENAKHWSKKH